LVYPRESHEPGRSKVKLSEGSQFLAKRLFGLDAYRCLRRWSAPQKFLIVFKLVMVFDAQNILWISGQAGNQLGLIVRSTFSAESIDFLTPDTFGQQVAYMNRPRGEIIQAHIHEPISRHLVGTQEVLYVRSGRIRVDFYESDRTYVTSAVLLSGDLMLLNTGGHGFEVLEDTDMIEIKQGPFAEGRDKTRFVPEPHEIRYSDKSTS
jgi:hypothetical protein